MKSLGFESKVRLDVEVNACTCIFVLPKFKAALHKDMANEMK